MIRKEGLEHPNIMCRHLYHLRILGYQKVSIQLSDYTSDDFTTMKLRLYNWRKIYNQEIETQKCVTEEDELEALVTPEQLAVFETGQFARKTIKLFCQLSEEPAFFYQ